MLDVNTAKGQISLEYEMRAVKLWQHYYPDFSYVHTPKDGSALVDAIIVDHHEADIVAVVEQKSRNMSLEQLQKWDYEWLITFDKIEQGRYLGQALGVPYIGFLYLIPDDLLITLKISNSAGQWTCDFRTDITETQETINGGKIERLNAYIKVDNAQHLEAYQ
jgi:hypothetical protein